MRLSRGNFGVSFAFSGYSQTMPDTRLGGFMGSVAVFVFTILLKSYDFLHQSSRGVTFVPFHAYVNCNCCRFDDNHIS